MLQHFRPIHEIGLQGGREFFCMFLDVHCSLVSNFQTVSATSTAQFRPIGVFASVMTNVAIIYLYSSDQTLAVEC